MGAWEKMYADQERKKQGMVIANPQETIRKMYEKLVQNPLGKRGHSVPLPSEIPQEEAAKDDEKKGKTKEKKKKDKKTKKKAKKKKAKKNKKTKKKTLKVS